MVLKLGNKIKIRIDCFQTVKQRTDFFDLFPMFLLDVNWKYQRFQDSKFCLMEILLLFKAPTVVSPGGELEKKPV